MDIPPKNPNSDRAGASPLLRRLDQATVALLLAVSLLLMALAVLTRYWQGRGLIEIDRAPPQVIDFRVDINRAGWPELALLPDVGETLARRIVESRQQNGPFVDQQDLLRVPGVGPLTLEKMRPYLLPLASAGDLTRGGEGALARPAAAAAGSVE
ncbi:MAG: helix-hairpin-helix domain-containing protein [Candidatus Anammoximicrobium sp.]|nr:helix-hairpin-helix domain-containing protein [Candidatus Anammoximicrobium sp.]